MPKSHQAHRDWSPGRFLNWAADIGPCTAQVVKQQLEDRPHPEHGYRACLGLLNLGRRYDRQRLEKACERALAIRSASYQSVASILKAWTGCRPGTTLLPRKNCPCTATSAAPATTTEGGEHHAEPTDYRPTARPQAHRHA